MVFHIVGGFDGDDILIAESLDLAHRLTAPDAALVPVAEIAGLLERLPFPGRMAFAAHALMRSPARDALVTGLFEWCFEGDDGAAAAVSAAEDEFVLVGSGASRSLNAHRHFVMRVLVSSLPSDGALPVDLFRRYSVTTSTAFRVPLLLKVVRNPAFSDDQLEAAYLDAVKEARAAIFKAAKRTPHRGPFVARLVAAGHEKVANLIWADEGALRRVFGDPTRLQAFQAGGYGNFKARGAVYLQYLEARLQSLSAHPLEQGAELRTFEGLIRGEPLPGHILTLLALCLRYQPLEVMPGVRKEIADHLRALSRAGTLERDYEDLRGVLPAPRLLGHLTNVPQLLADYSVMTDRGVVFREPYGRLCQSLLGRPARKRLREISTLAAECLRTLHPGEFKDVLLLPEPAAKSPQRVAYEAYRSFLDDFTMQNQHQHSSVVLTAWVALHLRTLKAYPNLGHKWLVSLLSAFKPIVAQLSKATQKRVRIHDPHGARTGITLTCGYLTGIVLQLKAALEVPDLDLSPELYLEAVLPVLDPAVGLVAGAMGCAAVDRLNAALEGFIADTLLPFVERRLILDPTSPDRITNPQLRTLNQRLIEGLRPLFPSQPRTRAAMLAFAQRVLTEAQLPADVAARGFQEYVEVTDGKRRRCFATVEPAVYAEATDMALRLVKALVKSAAYAKDADQCKEAWEVYKAQEFQKPLYGGGGRIALQTSLYVDSKRRASYLDMCADLPPSVVARETPTLVALGKMLAEGQAFETNARSFARLGLVAKVMEAATGIGKDAAQRFIREAEPVSVPAVREYLEGQTHQREPEARMAAHVTLLSRSLGASLAEVARSLEFVAARVKHESGLTRPGLYRWVESQAAALVRWCLEEGAADHTVALLRAMERMLRDDLSKRDTVGRASFWQVADSILTEATAFDWGKPLQDLRRLWITGAVRMHFLLIKAKTGVKGLREYDWPLRGPMPSTGWVFEEGLTARILPLLVAQCGPTEAATARAEFYERGLLRPGGEGPLLTPADVVGLLCGALEAVQQEQRGAEEDAGQELPVPGEGAVADTLDPHHARMLTLLRYCAGRWVEVPLLVDYVAGLRDAVRDLDAKDLCDRFLRCGAVFRALRMEDPLWYEIPILADCVDALLIAAVRLKHKDAPKAADGWREAHRLRGRVDFGSLTDAERQFLSAAVPRLRPRGLYGVASQLEATRRRVTAAARLLRLSPSAIYLPRIQEALIAHRDDRLPLFIGRTHRDLAGPFAPNGEEEEGPDPFNVVLSRPRLLRVSGRTSQSYSQVALRQGMARSRSLAQRSAAIERYVGAPSTGHRDVIALLRDLTDKATQEGGDDGLPVIMETVILSVFRTDAAWHVLAYLLSPEVIAATPQRTTASILSSFVKCVCVESLVRVLEILLSPERRRSVTLFLHKSILRLLVEAGTAEAGALLWREWVGRGATPLHPDLSYELIRLAVRGLLTSKPIAEVAWGIAEEAATDATLPVPAAALLLLPAWRPTVPRAWRPTLGAFFAGVDCPTRPGAEELSDPGRAVAVLLRDLEAEFGASFEFTDGAPCPRLRRLMGKLQAHSPSEALRSLAWCKALSYSPAVVGEEDAETLDEMRLALTTPSPRLGDLELFTRLYTQRMYATLALRILTREYEALAATWEPRSTVVQSLCTSHPAARHVRQCMATLLDGLLNTPPKDHIARSQWAETVKSIVADVESSSIPSLKRELIDAPLSVQFFLLQKDARAVADLDKGA